MTIDAGDTKTDAAKEQHESAEYEAAADEYAAAAYEYLGENGLEHSVAAARGLRVLSIAAACRRYRGDDAQCRNLCWQGVYLSNNIGDSVLERPPASHPHDQSERGIWYEFEGDFRLVGGLPDATDAYDRAEGVYRSAGDPRSASLEQFHGNVAVLMKLLVRGTGADTDELHELLPNCTLSSWIDYKRTALPDALDRLDGADEWTYVF